MSVVAGVTFICSSEELDVSELLESALVGLCDEGFDGKLFPELSGEYGGRKHPQCHVYGAGINHMKIAEFAERVMEYEWAYPENVVLVVQPEAGDTMVYRPRCAEVKS